MDEIPIQEGIISWTLQKSFKFLNNEKNDRDRVKELADWAKEEAKAPEG